MENKFSANLRLLRKKNKLTLEELGKELGISKSAISDYENGNTFPSLDVTKNICNFFGINIDDMQNSDFSELTLEEIQNSRNNPVPKVVSFDISTTQKQLEFQNKLLSQQVEGLQIQLQLVKQLTESKSSEIKSLQIQIRLLEEKLRESNS
jgi:transcriptional regulator with XRE-family HTH domain